MDRYVVVHGSDGRPCLAVPLRGASLLRHPTYNKGTAFNHEERRAFGLTGLLPAAVSSIEQQAHRVYANIVRKDDPLERHVGLAALQDRNETLFHRVLEDHLEEFLPVLYGPTLGRVCKEFSHVFRRARGIWITPGQRGAVDDVLASAPFDDVRLVVITDNEHVLGLGDQGAGGIGLAIGKLALYTAAAGIPPWQTLPISLDVGTDNRALFDDDLYLGWRHERLRGEQYESLVEELVRGIRRRFPRAIVQWEDLTKENAFRLLARYRKTLPSFNDDIQGTAAVALAAILGAGRVTGTPLSEQRVVVLGAGVAGIGVARLLREALRRTGLQTHEAIPRVAVLDSRGLLVDDAPAREPWKHEFSWPAELAVQVGLPLGARDLASVVRALRPTVLVGTAGVPGAFSRQVLGELAAGTARPLVLPLGRPDSRAEASAADVLAWTGGRALVAGGDLKLFVFPAIALGAMVSEAREITDGMFVAAAERLAEEATADRLFPRISDLRRATARVAEAVVAEARDSGVGRVLPDGAIPAEVAEAMWEPRYMPLVPALPSEWPREREQAVAGGSERGRR